MSAIVLEKEYQDTIIKLNKMTENFTTVFSQLQEAQSEIENYNEDDDSDVEEGEGVQSIAPEAEEAQEADLPTFLVTIDSTTTSWTAGRIAKQHQISAETLAEYNGDPKTGEIYITPKTKFRKGTTLHIPIFKVTAEHIDDMLIEPAGLPNTTPLGKIKSRKLFAKSAATGYVFACKTEKNGTYRRVNDDFDIALCENAAAQINDLDEYCGPHSESTFVTDGGNYCFNLQLSSILTPNNSKAAHAKDNPHSEHWYKSEQKEMSQSI